MDPAIDELIKGKFTKAYSDGLYDGVRTVVEALLDVDGVVKQAKPDGVYKGPMPPELKAWACQLLDKLPPQVGS